MLTCARFRRVSSWLWWASCLLLSVSGLGRNAQASPHIAALGSRGQERWRHRWRHRRRYHRVYPTATVILVLLCRRSLRPWHRRWHPRRRRRVLQGAVAGVEVLSVQASPSETLKVLGTPAAATGRVASECAWVRKRTLRRPLLACHLRRSLRHRRHAVVPCSQGHPPPRWWWPSRLHLTRTPCWRTLIPALASSGRRQRVL